MGVRDPISAQVFYAQLDNYMSMSAKKVTSNDTDTHCEGQVRENWKCALMFDSC